MVPNHSLPRALALVFLAAVGVALFAAELPDRSTDAEAFAPLGADPTHQREDLVFAVQVELAQGGFDSGSVDGVRGARTTRAIQAFRAWAGPAEGDDTITGDLLADLRRRPLW